MLPTMLQGDEKGKSREYTASDEDVSALVDRLQKLQAQEDEYTTSYTKLQTASHCSAYAEASRNSPATCAFCRDPVNVKGCPTPVGYFQGEKLQSAQMVNGR